MFTTKYLGLMPSKEIAYPYENFFSSPPTPLENPSSINGEYVSTYLYDSFYDSINSNGFIETSLFSLNPYRVNYVKVTCLISGVYPGISGTQDYLISYTATWNTPPVNPPFEEAISQESEILHQYPLEINNSSILDFPFPNTNTYIAAKYDSNGGDIMNFIIKFKGVGTFKGIYETI